jgi:hypothetical protein
MKEYLKVGHLQSECFSDRRYNIPRPGARFKLDPTLQGALGKIDLFTATWANMGFVELI